MASVFPIQDNINEVLNQEKQFGLSTGILELDKAILGLRPQHLIVIAAYSGIGKTSLITDLVLAAAKEVPVALFSIEMGEQILIERMIYNVAGLNYHRGISGDLSTSDKQDLNNACEYIKTLNPVYINESANTMYPSWILKKESPENSMEVAIDNYIQQGCKAIFIDYIQIINYGYKIESETLRLKEITNYLHDACIKYDIPIVALSQLKKGAGDTRQKDFDSTPTLSDIRDGGFIINDADVILLLHRPEYFRKKQEIDLFENRVEDAQIIVGKQRSGPLGALSAQFKAYCMKWCGIDSGEI